MARYKQRRQRHKLKQDIASGGFSGLFYGRTFRVKESGAVRSVGFALRKKTVGNRKRLEKYFAHEDQKLQEEKQEIFDVKNGLKPRSNVWVKEAGPDPSGGSEKYSKSTSYSFNMMCF